MEKKKKEIKMYCWSFLPNKKFQRGLGWAVLIANKEFA